ncbi:MAG: NRDE family protein [Burkholderiales bacterium]
MIVIGWKAHARFPLIVAANRDEFHGRPAAPAAFWQDLPDILAGRDLQAMGTWMGVSRGGRFAAVTNYRGGTEPSARHSRGELVTGFLQGSLSAARYADSIEKSSYSGFNLLACDREELWWMSNRDGAPRRLGPGHYALGNLLLDSDDVQGVKRRVADTPAAVEPLFNVLASAKIVNPDYGTRCSTVLLQSGTDVRYAERSFAPDGSDGETVHFQFSPQA